MRRKLYAISMTALLGMSLTGCSTASKALGLTKSAPNEFNILTKAPLVVPPEYNLRPPRLGESNPEDNYSQKAAREALIGDVDAAEPTRGEVVLMTKAGVGRADQEIRVKIDGQNSVERKSDSLSARIMFWKDGNIVDENGVIIPLDPEAEAKRLKAIEAATGGGEVEITKKPAGPKLPGL